jgi:rRNA maturation endonuclease Nob1
MSSAGSDLSFIRCPQCRSLVPAASSRCRMCGHRFSLSEDEGEDGRGLVQANEKGKKNGRKSESEGPLPEKNYENIGDSSGEFEAKRSQRVRLRTTSLSSLERDKLARSDEGASSGKVAIKDSLPKSTLSPSGVSDAASSTESKGNIPSVVSSESSVSSSSYPDSHSSSRPHGSNGSQIPFQPTGDENPLAEFLVDEDEELISDDVSQEEVGEEPESDDVVHNNQGLREDSDNDDSRKDAGYPPIQDSVSLSGSSSETETPEAELDEEDKDVDAKSSVPFREDEPLSEKELLTKEGSPLASDESPKVEMANKFEEEVGEKAPRLSPRPSGGSSMAFRPRFGKSPLVRPTEKEAQTPSAPSEELVSFTEAIPSEGASSGVEQQKPSAFRVAVAGKRSHSRFNFRTPVTSKEKTEELSKAPSAVSSETHIEVSENEVSPSLAHSLEDAPQEELEPQERAYGDTLVVSTTESEVSQKPLDLSEELEVEEQTEDLKPVEASSETSITDEHSTEVVQAFEFAADGNDEDDRIEVDRVEVENESTKNDIRESTIGDHDIVEAVPIEDDNEEFASSSDDESVLSEEMSVIGVSNEEDDDGPVTHSSGVASSEHSKTLHSEAFQSYETNPSLSSSNEVHFPSSIPVEPSPTVSRETQVSVVRREASAVGRLFGWFVSYLNPEGDAVELREGKFFISSEKVRKSDLVIDDPSLSSPHAMVSLFQSQGLVVQDLMSERGVFVRRKGNAAYRKEEDAVRLEHGDWLRIGDVEFLVVLIAHVGKATPY